MAERLKKKKPLSRLAQKKLIRSLPPYVMFRSTEMRLRNPEYDNKFFCWNDLKVEYYRDRGCWSVDFQIIDGKVFSKHHNADLNEVELKPISYTRWRKGNAGSLNKNTKAYTI